VKTQTVIAILFFSLLQALGSSGLPSVTKQRYEEQPGEGKALVRELLAQKPAQNAQHLGTLKIRTEDNQRTEIPVKMVLEVKGDTWEDVYQTQKSRHAPPQLLIIKRGDGKPNEYWFAKKTSIDNPVAPVQLKPEEIYQPFGYSDFWICDLGLEFLHWPEHHIVDKEMRSGRSCKVVESTNPKPVERGYARVLSWIDNETGGLVRAEAYDSANKLLKEFSIKSVQKVNGRYQLKEMQIINPQNDSRTKLEFNLELEAPQSDSK
jgi:hypothetical protein